MHNKKRRIERFFGSIVILMSLLMIPIILFGGEADNKPAKKSESQPDYILKIKGNLISLKAKNASLKEILEEIGRRMKIDVVANIPKEEKITVELDRIYLGDALKRFKTNYAYITESRKEKGKINKIVVIPKDLARVPVIPQKKSVVVKEEKRIEFDYNPQPPVQTYEVTGENKMVEPGIKGRTSDHKHQPSVETYEDTEENKLVEPGIRAREDVGTEEPSHTVPSKYDYNPQPSMR